MKLLSWYDTKISQIVYEPPSTELTPGTLHVDYPAFQMGPLEGSSLCSARALSAQKDPFLAPVRQGDLWLIFLYVNQVPDPVLGTKKYPDIWCKHREGTDLMGIRGGLGSMHEEEVKVCPRCGRTHVIF